MPSETVMASLLFEHDELHKIIVPGIDEGEDGKRPYAGLDDGQHDIPEGAQFARAVDSRGLQKLGGRVSENCFIKIRRTASRRWGR